MHGYCITATGSPIPIHAELTLSNLTALTKPRVPHPGFWYTYLLLHPARKRHDSGDATGGTRTAAGLVSGLHHLRRHLRADNPECD